jgi:hypothetical protein
MLHVNRLDGLTVAVSENPFLTQIAKGTVLSDDALGVLVPILQEIAGWNSREIRSCFNSGGFVLQDWAGSEPIGLPSERTRIHRNSRMIRNAAVT